MSQSWRVLFVLAILSLGCAKRQGVQIREIFHFDTSGWAHDIALEGSKIYVSDRQGGFLIFDRSANWKEFKIAVPVKDVISLAPNSGAPVLASRFEGLVLLSPSGQISDRYSNGDIANAVEVRGDLAFAAYGLHGLVVVRLFQNHFQLLSTLPTKGWSHDVRLSRNQALLADWRSGLRIIDIHNPEKPAEICYFPSPATCISLALREFDDRRILALAEGHAGIALIVLDAEGHPSLLSRNLLGLNPADPIHPDSGGWVHSVAWAGRYLFAADWKRGLVVLDSLDIHNPKVILEIPSKGTALGVKAQRQPDGSYLIFLAEGEAGIRVFRFSG
jgi:hypothetical protein